MDKLLLDALPVERPRELVRLNPTGMRNGWTAGDMTWSYQAYRGINEGQRVFTGLLAERSDIQEEIVRLQTHIQHFVGLLDQGGEVGKKLDFLLQELNREANTVLSKTSGIAGEALRITELGLQMKSDIEKCREQVQNIE